MVYGDFTLPDLVTTFGLALEETRDLFGAAPEVAPSAALRELLADSVPFAQAMNTEKGRSELIVAPILLELRRLMERRITWFSGIDFTVDPEAGLRGLCDFLICRSTELLFIRAPVVAVVEAKNESIKGGLAQCIAEMVAAYRFNERQGTGGRPIYGIVTTGSTWKFLQMDWPTVAIDVPEYHISGVGKILGTLIRMVS